jgi:heat-inducible transcriptional repressor
MDEQAAYARQRAILLEIVQHYLAHSEPVSARLLSKISRLELSPTTIRNLMEDLSSEGLLTNEGVSRGRVPTQKAFSLYVASLGRGPAPRAGGPPPFAPPEGAAPASLAELLEQVGRFLVKRTECIALVALPPWDRYPMDWVRFAATPGGGVLVAVHTLLGDLLAKVIETSEPLPEDVLAGLQHHIAQGYRGRAIADIRSEIMAGEPKDVLGGVVSLGAAFRLLRRAFEWEERPRHTVWGQERLLGWRESAPQERLGQLLAALADPALFEIALAHAQPLEQGLIALGTDTGYPGLEEMALVAFPLRFGENWSGWLALLGPMRMEYRLVLQTGARCAEAVQVWLGGRA